MKIIFSIVLLLLAYSCSNSGNKADNNTPNQNQTDVPAANMQDAMNQAQDAIKKAQLQQPVEPVNFRTLQELLGEKLGGFELVKKGGETAGAMGMKVSRAEGKYKDDSGKNLQLDIVDTGGMGMGMLGTAAWASVTIDKEDENGYERTSTLKGYKSFEKFKKNGATTELALIAENRFVVTASCRSCSMETMREVMEALDLDKLKGLK